MTICKLQTARPISQEKRWYYAVPWMLLQLHNYQVQEHCLSLYRRHLNYIRYSPVSSDANESGV